MIFKSTLGREIAPEDREYIADALNERLPDGDIKTCEDFKYFNVECCETCHTFYPESEMYLVDLPDGGKGWICDGVRGELFPETKVSADSPDSKMLDWFLSGNRTEDMPPELKKMLEDAEGLDVGDVDAEPEDKE